MSDKLDLNLGGVGSGDLTAAAGLTDYTKVAEATSKELEALGVDTSNPEEGNKGPSKLCYPYGDPNEYGGKISFKMKKIEPEFLSGSGQGALDKAKKATTAAYNAIQRLGELDARGTTEEEIKAYSEERAQILTDFSDALSPEQKSSLGSGEPNPFDIISASGRRTVPTESPTIDLYLPVALNVSDNLAYDTPSIGISGMIIGNSLAQSGSLLGATGDALMAGFNSIYDFAMGNQAGTAARLGAVRLARKLPDEVKYGAQLAAAVTVNPHIRAMFRNVGLREFSFQFKFIARSRREAQEVAAIIKLFRYHAYPTSIAGDDLGISLGYEFPDLFDIAITFNGTQVGTRLKLCHLRGISTNYNPSSMAFHEDGKPVEIDLTLNFVEEMTLDRADIEAGY